MSHFKSDPVLKVPQFHPCVENSVVLEAKAVDEVMDMIEKTLHTGNLGDGKIFILPVEEAVRVRTGERGKQALY
jgi:nitrogen regulatory protein P-II 1